MSDWLSSKASRTSSGTVCVWFFKVCVDFPHFFSHFVSLSNTHVQVLSGHGISMVTRASWGELDALSRFASVVPLTSFLDLPDALPNKAAESPAPSSSARPEPPPPFPPSPPQQLCFVSHPLRLCVLISGAGKQISASDDGDSRRHLTTDALDAECLLLIQRVDVPTSRQISNDSTYSRACQGQSSPVCIFLGHSSAMRNACARAQIDRAIAAVSTVRAERVALPGGGVCELLLVLQLEEGVVMLAPDTASGRNNVCRDDDDSGGVACEGEIRAAVSRFILRERLLQLLRNGGMHANAAEEWIEQCVSVYRALLTSAPLCIDARGNACVDSRFVWDAICEGRAPVPLSQSDQDAFRDSTGASDTRDRVCPLDALRTKCAAFDTAFAAVRSVHGIGHSLIVYPSSTEVRCVAPGSGALLHARV